MGQAMIDEALSPPPSPLSGADDLLSQMAGEQIDRMIAEGESTKSHANESAVDPFATQLDDLFNQLNEATPADAVSVKQIAEVVAEPIAPPIESQVKIPPPPAVVEIEQPTTAAEREALKPVEDAISQIQISAVVNQVELDHTPILVRILELINAPFAACPDAVRDVLGKFAILTLMNSLGVLLYVVLFRKH